MNQSVTQTATSSTTYSILFSICLAHFINDLLQIVLQSNFPIFKEDYSLTYAQIGIITFTFQITSSILQPFVGNFTDKHPMPYSFVIGMTCTLIGIISLSLANGYISILISSSIIGMGSSIFHPESSKLAFYAAGGRRGLAQSIFQIGGNTGTAIGPLLVTLIVIPKGQRYIAVFGVFAVLGIFLLYKVGNWYQNFIRSHKRQVRSSQHVHLELPKRKVEITLLILLILIFSKYFYMASMTSFVQFFLIDKFHFSVKMSQTYLFVFLIAVALGTLIGGPLGDKIGRKFVIWFSILGSAPFALMLPYANATWVLILLVFIGLILSSAFSSILVYGQELLPGRTGMVSGFFYGFAFGMGGIGAAVLGSLADSYGMSNVFIWCSFLPLLGMLAVYIPNLKAIENKEI